MKSVLPFVLLTCLISWLAAGVAYLIGIKIQTIQYVVFGIIYMFFPAVCAVLFQKFRNKESVRKSLFLSFRLNRWFLVAWLTPMIIAVLSIIIGLIMPGVSLAGSIQEGFVSQYKSILSPEIVEGVMEKLNKQSAVQLLFINILQASMGGLTANTIAAFGEELGWRGYMLRHLRNWSFMKVSLFTGFIWGIWHFPLILMGHNYPNYPVGGILMMTIFCLLLSPILTYLVIKSKSVFTAAIYHGTINGFAGITSLYLIGNELLKGFTGLTGFIAIVIVTVCFYLFDRFITKEHIFSDTLDSVMDKIPQK